MARPEARLAANAPGPFFVDETCIDCGTCRWMAPESFDRSGGLSRVYRQPAGPEAERAAERALVACPVAAIGADDRRDLRAARDAFPHPVDGPVYHCGYHSPDSFGAASWLIRREDGNVLVDSPRFARPLVERIEAMGGVRYMFLSHRDDVADHAEFAAHFGCERILHEDDVGHGTREVETRLKGDDPVELAADLTLIPVPGHTRGSVCLLFRERFLFSGDHVAFSPERGHIHAFRDACWYSWPCLKESMVLLATHRFEWILPGHGHPCHFPGDEMAREMQRCLDWLALTD